MARRLRVEYHGAIYHVINRGDRKEPIFISDDDRIRFLSCLEECCTKTAWQIHAFVLMPNHFHLVVETPQPNLVAGMKWFLGTYTIRFNRRHQLVGHLFSGRYKSLLIDGSGSGYLKTVCDYVHLNPARANSLEQSSPLSTFQWSSWPMYLKPRSKRPNWLRVDRLLGEHGIPKDSIAGRRELERRVEARRAAESGDDYQTIRSDWCLGDDAFREELLEQVSQRLGPEHYGVQRSENDESKAERIIAEELKKRNWMEADFEARRKSDREKVAIAQRLRSETLRSVEWIASRLHLGSRKYAALLLCQAAKKDQLNRPRKFPV